MLGLGLHPETQAEQVPLRSIPGIGIALFPIVLVIACNFLFTKYLIPALDNTYLAEPKYGATSLNSVLGIWSIIGALVLACLTLVLVHARRWTNLKVTLNTGTRGALLPIFNTASEVGYGSVIASLAAFVVIRDFLVDLAPGNPLISEAILVNVLAGVTGSASSGMRIALNTIGDAYLHLAQQFGISLELMHRVASMASGGLDSLPHNGAVITALAMCGLTHKQSYFDIFVVAVVVPLVALAAVIAV